MPNKTYKPLKVAQSVKTEVDEHGKMKLKSVNYHSNINKGDYLERLIIFSDTVVKIEYYEVQEIEKSSIRVSYQFADDEGSIRTGYIGFQQLLGSINPAPNRVLITQYKLIEMEEEK